jgi:drug/metabolite transporter (DMT)-like permease
VWLRAMPVVFVLIWSTGFIVARYGMPHAPPLTFLSIRYALSVVCFGVWILASGAQWPRSRSQWMHLAVSGVLMHAGYLGGVWAAVKAGMGAGTVALLVGLQPVLTALWLSASSAGSVGLEGRARVSMRQWTGLLLGLAGLVLVVWRKLGAGELTPFNITLAVFALLCITTGTLYQKRFVQACDVRTANTVQLLAALLLTAPLAALESEQLVLHSHFLGALVWSVLGLTLGGSSLLYLLIQRGAATQVTSLLYLVPPTTAVMAWLLFGEAMTGVMLIGMALTAAGVWLVARTEGKPEAQAA